MACGDDAEDGINIRVGNNPPVSLFMPCEQVWTLPLCFQTIVGSNKRHRAQDSATGCNNAFSLKFIQMMAFLKPYNNSLRMPSHKYCLNIKWNPTAPSLVLCARCRHARVLQGKGASLRQARCKVEDLTLNGPPRCTDPSFTEQSD